MTRRSLILAAVTSGGVGVAGAHASGAFDNVVSDRGFDIRVGSADAGLLGIDIYTVEFSSSSTEELITLTNNFSDPLTTIDVDTADHSGVVQGLETPPSIEPGESEPIEADLACDSDVDRDVPLDIDVSTDSEAISVTRAVPIACQSSDSGSVIETDGLDLDDDTIDSNVEIHGSGGGSNIDVSMDGSSIYGYLDVDIRSGGNVITIDVDDSTIEGDLTVSPGGGGTDIYIYVDNSTIKGNLAVSPGGGGMNIYIDVDDSTIEGDLTVDTSSGGIEIDVNIDDDSTIEGEENY